MNETVNDDTEITPATAPESLASRMIATLDAAAPKEAVKTVAKAEPVIEAANETNLADAEHGETEDAERDEENEAEGDGEASEDDDEKSTEPDPEMVSALKKYGVSLDLTDIPDAARAPLVKKIAAMEKGFTKAMQDVRGYRAEKAEFDTEKEYASKQTEKYIADMIDKDPALIDRVNAEVEKRKDPTYSEALTMQRQAAKDRAAADAQARAQQEAAHADQVASLDAYVVSSVKQAKVPFALVQDAIINAQRAKWERKEGLMTEAEIDELVKAKAQVYQRGLSGAKGSEKRKYVEDKLGDKAKNPNRTKPTGGGVTPAPRTDGKPLTMREKMLATLDAVGA